MKRCGFRIFDLKATLLSMYHLISILLEVISLFSVWSIFCIAGMEKGYLCRRTVVVMWQQPSLSSVLGVQCLQQSVAIPKHVRASTSLILQYILSWHQTFILQSVMGILNSAFDGCWPFKICLSLEANAWYKLGLIHCTNVQNYFLSPFMFQHKIFSVNVSFYTRMEVRSYEWSDIQKWQKLYCWGELKYLTSVVIQLIHTSQTYFKHQLQFSFSQSQFAGLIVA